MRTTVEFDEDTAKAVEQLRQDLGIGGQDLGIGVSQAVNELIRRGLHPRPEAPPFRQRTRPTGIRIDVSNVAAALEHLEGVEAR